MLCVWLHHKTIFHVYICKQIIIEEVHVKYIHVILPEGTSLDKTKLHNVRTHK